ncbi:ATP-binding protein [Streptomyces sp. NPDC053750]|uniref:ATP-binding protein n=1 Tax=Streptomyces sp. NPDC053750 TaxID=3365714 RepID=UPI0037D0F0A5
MFPTTAHGAHAARHAAADSMSTAFLLIAELTANAALHGQVRGRNARLVLTLTPATLRIKVTDARGERQPVPAPATDADGGSGRGLLLVASLADAWGCAAHPPGGKTVWAECARRAPLRPAGAGDGVALLTGSSTEGAPSLGRS